MSLKNLEIYNKAFSGQTCFIIGSGCSINFIQDLSFLNDYYTIAVNGGYVAHNADFFVSDDWSVAHWSYFKDMETSKKTIPILYYDMLQFDCHRIEKSVIFKHRTGYNITDKYVHLEYENRICEARTSLGSAIHIAHIMGFDKIVLLGIDCCRYKGARYFWDIGKWNKPKRFDNIPTDKYRRVMSDNYYTDTDLLQILDYWKIAGKEFNKCNIYNVSEISKIDCFRKIELNKLLPECIKKLN